MKTNKREIKYKDLKTINLKRYYAEKTTESGALFNWIYLAITTIICFRALHFSHELIGQRDVMPLQNIFFIILVVSFIISADEECSESNRVSLYSPSLLWIIALFMLYTNLIKPQAIIAIMLVAIISFVYLFFNSTIAPLYPILRFKIKFVFGFFERLLVLLVLNLTFVIITGIFSYFHIFKV